MYHVEVIPKVWEPPHRREEQENDLLFEELERRFLAPYRKAKPIVIRGRTIATDDIHRIRIYETQQEIGTPASIPLGPMADVTKEFIIGPPGWELEEGSADAKESRPPANAREVFVVHGRNNEARDALFTFLRSIGLDPLEWTKAVHATGRQHRTSAKSWMLHFRARTRSWFFSHQMMRRGSRSSFDLTAILSTKAH